MITPNSLDQTDLIKSPQSTRSHRIQLIKQISSKFTQSTRPHQIHWMKKILPISISPNWTKSKEWIRNFARTKKYYSSQQVNNLTKTKRPIPWMFIRSVKCSSQSWEKYRNWNHFRSMLSKTTSQRSDKVVYNVFRCSFLASHDRAF